MTAQISVSHGSLTRGFALHASLYPSSLVPKDSIPYCGVAAVAIEGEKAELVLDGSNTHIKGLTVDDDQLQYAQQIVTQK